MKAQLLRYTSYNIWANTRFAELLKGLDPSLLDKEIPSSFSSLRKTAHHIWDAELIWLSRMKNQVVAWPPSAQFVNPAIDEFVNGSKAFDEFIRLSDEEFLSGSTSYKNTKGASFSTGNADIVMHCMNHSTFHRGQLVTMLRSLGHNRIPATDFIAYVREI